MDVRPPEKQTNLWRRQNHRGWALGGPFSPASERHGSLMGEAGPLAAEFPSTSLPGPWPVPRPSGLHQVADIALFQPIPIGKLHQGPSTHRGQGEPEQQERLHAEPQIHAAPRAAAAPASRRGGGEVGRQEAKKGASRGWRVRARSSGGSLAAECAR